MYFVFCFILCVCVCVLVGLNSVVWGVHEVVCPWTTSFNQVEVASNIEKARSMQFIGWAARARETG